MKLKKWWWIVLGVIFLYPFYCLIFNWVFGWNLGTLYTFELDLRDFIPAWIAFGGVVGVVANFFLSRKRMDEQRTQFAAQIEIQRQQQCNDRFASGVELLSSTNESTRIGGAYSLYYLAHDNKEYLTTVCEILCAHLRTIANREKFQTEKEREEYPADEIKRILDLLFSPVNLNEKVSIFVDTEKNLKAILLYKIDLQYRTLIRARFDGSEIIRVSFFNAELIKVDFRKAILYLVVYEKAKLESVFFVNPQRFSLIDFSNATLVKFQHPSFEKGEEVETVSFVGTPLESVPYKEITRPGFSWKLTKPDIQTKQTATP